MSIEEKLQQAETDVERLSVRALGVIPLLKRIADNPDDWRRESANTLMLSLAEAIATARLNQARRRA